MVLGYNEVMCVCVTTGVCVVVWGFKLYNKLNFVLEVSAGLDIIPHMVTLSVNTTTGAGTWCVLSLASPSFLTPNVKPHSPSDRLQQDLQGQALTGIDATWKRDPIFSQGGTGILGLIV